MKGAKAMIEAIPTGVVVTADRESGNTIFFFCSRVKSRGPACREFRAKQKRLKDKSTATAGLVSRLGQA